MKLFAYFDDFSVNYMKFFDLQPRLVMDNAKINTSEESQI